MKRKLLLLATFVVSALGMRAQTDVTSTYITNAGFEAGTVAENTSAQTFTTGWKTTSALSYGRYAVIDNNTDPGSYGYGKSDASEGNNFLMIRTNNNPSSDYTHTVQQASSMKLPKGIYRISFDYKDITTASTNPNFKVQAKSGSTVIGSKQITIDKPATTDNYFSSGAGKDWSTTSFDFVLNQETDITLYITCTYRNRTVVLLDNFVLEYSNISTDLAAIIANAQRVNALLSDTDLATAITAASTVYNEIDNTIAYQTTIDDAITALHNAITTAYSSAKPTWNHEDDLTAIISNAGFETNPIFDGSSLGVNGTTNATATVGSELLDNAVNVYNIPGWDLMTTETSDYARTFTMPFNTTLYVKHNNNNGGQVVASPANGSSVTTSNNSLLFVEATWCQNEILGVQQTVTLPAGIYKLTFDTYASTNYSNGYSRCGISYGNTTNYKWPTAVNTWTANEIEFTLSDEGEVTFSLGYKKKENVGSGSSPFLFVDNVKLTYLDPLGQAQDQWQTVHDELEEKDLTELPSAAANEITTELAKTVPTTTVDDVNAAKTALQNLINSYDGIKAAYSKLNELIATANDINTYSVGGTSLLDAIGTANTNKETRTTASGDNSLGSDYTDLENALHDYMTSGAEPADGHPFDITFKINNPGFEADGKTGDALTPTGWSIPTKGEKYGTKAKGSISNANGKYVFNNWSQWWNALNVQQTVNDLPKGRYEVTAILAGYNGVATKLEAGGGTTWMNTTDENNGIRFSVIGNVTGTSLTIKAQTVGKDGGSLLIADDFTLSFIGNKPVLHDLITKATTLSTSNIGTGVFQIPESAKTTLESAIETAQGIYDDDTKYGDDIKNAIDALNTAIDNFKATALNPPASDKHYNIVVATSGHARVGNAVVVSLGTTSDNNPTGYTFKASAAPAAHLAQAVAFTSANDAEHPNRYYITFEGPNGTLYLTNGTQNSSAAGWSDSQIQGTTDATKKLGFDIVATTTDNVFNIINTATNSSIACQTGDNVGNLYTESGNADFTLVEASQASVTLKITDAKWGTFIVPFTAEIPDGVTAYTATSDGTSITLSDPITDSFAANTPYIVYSESTQNETFTGWGTATQDPYTFGQLTGTYTRIFAPANSYILQKNDDKVGFYLCDVEETYVVAKNRCYLTPSAGNGVKAFILGDFADDIQTIFSGNNEGAKGDIYDLTGRKVNKATKGIYIINGKKVMMK